MTNRVTHTLEELANVATHGLGLLASVAALPLFIIVAARGGDTLAIVGVTIFGATLVAAYGASCCYHMVQPGARKVYWRRMDQAAVYLLIAGTYTPFSLGALRGPVGWLLLGTIWLAALIAIGVKVGLRVEAPRLENATYLCMGWLIVVAGGPLAERIGFAGLAWLVVGGLAYTVGAVILMYQSRLRFAHCVWHVLVLGGSACHAVAVVNYGLVLPR